MPRQSGGMHEATKERRAAAAAGLAPAAEDVAAARRILAELREAAAATRLHISRSSLLRIAAGCPVRRGTLLSFRYATGLIAELPMDAAGEVVE